MAPSPTFHDQGLVITEKHDHDDKARSELPVLEQDILEPIAVVGFSLKFPQDATSAEAFWKMLLEGRSALTEIPKDRFNIDAFYHPDAERHDTMNGRGAHFMRENIAAFDAPFFSMPPAEAHCLDPQQRSLLETTYHALENAGIPIESVTGSKTSVYVGSFSREYEVLFARDPELQAKYQATGTGTALLANRLSWFYDLRGPSISLDTACSSSLNALHLACQSLRTHESSMGIVCGSNLILNPETNMIPLSNMNFLSPDSKCQSFDHKANGYARGEGTGVVVLKLLSRAVQDGDLIRAVIRATGCNQDGRTPGISHPSKDAQAAMIQDTYLAGGLDLQTTRYFEAHGTGTPVGDAIEADALSTVFKKHRSREEPLFVGAVKSNIGHLEGASGLAGLIKTILVLEKGVIPPNIWFEKPNPAIAVDEWNLKFPVHVTPWPTIGLRRASVNSFGYGGANAHVVLEDAYNYMKIRGIVAKHRTLESPPRFEEISPTANGVPTSPINHAACADFSDGCSCRPRPRLLIWSAAEEAGIKRLAKNYQEHLLKKHNYRNGYLDDFAYTLSNRRSKLPWKSFLIAETTDDIRQWLPSKLTQPVRSVAENLKLGFVFTGQGAQWYAMGRDLLLYPIFRESLRSAEKFLQMLGCEWQLIDELLQAEKFSRVRDPEFAQPLCTALQIALVELLADWNILPTTVVGHSSGEIAAAYCAGGLSRESAWKIAYHRGALAARLGRSRSERGSMMAIALSEAEIQPHLASIAQEFGPDRLAVGCVNSPMNITVTGDEECLDTLKITMDQQQVFARKLEVNVAYHSTHMNDIASEYLGLIQDTSQPNYSQAHEDWPIMFSSVTGLYVSKTRLAQSEYWVENMASKVKFSDAISQMCSYSLHGNAGSESKDNTTLPSHLIEIGPHCALRKPLKEILPGAGTSYGLGYYTALTRGVSALQTMLELAGHLSCRGHMVDIRAVNSPQLRQSNLLVLSDLPEYPFNHLQSYWLESRLSRNFRFRKHGRHELLGTPTVDWNPAEGRWRNIIRAAENPWIKDHKFNGSELYPAAGMIVMAIEAARQTANPSLMITSYQLEDVTFNKALLVSMASEGVETQLYLRPRRNNNNKSEWNDFRLYTYYGDEWLEVCCGTIVTKYLNRVTKDQKVMDHHISRGWKDAFALGVKSCKTTVDSRELYDNWESFGFSFGPAFQTLRQVSFSENGEAVAIIDLFDWIAKIPSGASMDHVIHPTALDGIFHLTIAALSKGGRKPVPTMVPTQIDSLWISNNLLAHTDKQELKVYAKSTFQGYRETEFSVWAFDMTNNECQIRLEGYRGTAVSSIESSSLDGFEWRRLCFNIDWKPDWEILTDEEIATYCDKVVGASRLPSPELIDQSELVCLYFMSVVLTIVSRENFESSKPHISRYLKWMRHHYDRSGDEILRSNKFEGGSFMHDETHREMMLDRLGEGSPDGKLFVTVGRSLMQILRGNVDTLDLLFNGPLVRDFYAGAAFAASYEKIASYVDLVAHKNPNIRVLEIGAGTGGATTFILQKLTLHGYGESGVPRCSQYVYTDISPGFFDGARERFSKYADRMMYQVLDIERDPTQQGFESGTYDILIAAGVLHATTNIDTTLRHARKLLKPGGKLILFEPCNLDCARIPFVFGLLPGWWLGNTEQKRYWSPLLSEKDWHRTLQENNFSGAGICLRDYQDHRHTFSTIISTALEDTHDDPPAVPETLIITADNDPLQCDIAHQVMAQLRALGACEIVSLRDLYSRDLDIDRLFCISLLEIGDPFLYDVQEEGFATFKKLVQSASAIIWVTRGGGEATTRPEVGLIAGLGRALRSENTQLNFVELAVEENSSAREVARHIQNIYQRTLVTAVEQNESEYMEKGGALYINRVVEANSLNDRIHQKVGMRKAEMQKFQQAPTRALTLSISSPGLLDTLQFVDDESVAHSLKDDEVEVEVQATGVNFKDIMVAMGQLPANTLGLECSGIITRTGDGIPVAQFQPGDRVCCLAGGAYRTLVRAYSGAVSKISDDLSFTSAAALPVVFCTAYYAIVHLAHLKEKESILIHSGAGGVGQAAIQIAKILKADIYVTVGSEEKKKLLMDLYQIPQDHLFSNRSESYMEDIKEMTDGVDVILNSLSGEELRRSWGCIAPFGRFIEIGKRDIQNRESLPMAPFSRNVLFASVDLALIFEKSRSLTEELMTTMQTLVVEGLVQAPQPLHVYKCSELEKAFRFLQSGKNTGKTVVELHGDDIVPVVPSIMPTYYFDRNATYVIAGGFGGLGRSIAGWMVSRNARHLILLSRSGARNKTALELLDELKAKGVTVAAPICDISDEQALVSALNVCSRTMPPIKGCIQGSMVLKDGLFESMSLPDFKAAVKPKAQGSWNLHIHLPKSMDFFLLLSSTGGVLGSRGQSNYAAGNTYQDALARYRITHGQKCISLDLGMVLSVGFAAERREITESLKGSGYRGIREAEFHAMLEHLCDPSLQLQSSLGTQIVTGLETPKSMKSRGFIDKLYWMRKPLFRNLLQMGGIEAASSQASTGHLDYETLIKSAGTQDNAGRVICQALVKKLSKSLSIPEEDIDTRKPIHTFGVDSLVAVEIRYWLMKEMKADLSIFNILGNDSMIELSHFAAGKSDYLKLLPGLLTA